VELVYRTNKHAEGPPRSLNNMNYMVFFFFYVNAARPVKSSVETELATAMPGIPRYSGEPRRRRRRATAAITDVKRLSQNLSNVTPSEHAGRGGVTAGCHPGSQASSTGGGFLFFKPSLIFPQIPLRGTGECRVDSHPGRANLGAVQMDLRDMMMMGEVA